MKHYLFKAEISLEIYGIPLHFDASATGIANDGIGPYEFWGRKCTGKGVDFVDEFEVDMDTVTVDNDGEPYDSADFERAKEVLKGTSPDAATVDCVNEQIFEELDKGLGEYQEDKE